MVSHTPYLTLPFSSPPTSPHTQHMPFFPNALLRVHRSSGWNGRTGPALQCGTGTGGRERRRLPTTLPHLCVTSKPKIKPSEGYQVKDDEDENGDNMSESGGKARGWQGWPKRIKALKVCTLFTALWERSIHFLESRLVDVISGVFYWLFCCQQALQSHVGN